MTGELHDFEFNDDQQPRWIQTRANDGQHIMIAALIWFGLYYCVVRPFDLLVPSNETLRIYDDTGLKPRLSQLFPTWREYENIQ